MSEEQPKSEEQAKKPRRRLTMQDRMADLRAVAEKQLAKAREREQKAAAAHEEARSAREAVEAELAKLVPPDLAVNGPEEAP